MVEGITEFQRLVASAEHILVVGHTSPDGDCIGAILALDLALQQMGKQRVLVLPDAIPGSLDFLPGADRILIALPELPACDLVIIPDCSDLDRLGSVYASDLAKLANVPIVNVDHHLSNRLFGALNLVDGAAAAVCEQLFFLFSALDIPIDQQIATCLLTGIVTDTQTFRTPSTTPRVLRVATALVEAGAPLTMIADRVYNSRSLATLRLWGLALSELEEAGGVIWTRLDEAMLRQSGASWEESEPLVNLLSSVGTAEAILLFKEMPDGVVKVSLRSTGKVNVADVAANFGGGGHAGAAGCSLTVPLSVAKDLVVARLRESLALRVNGG